MAAAPCQSKRRRAPRAPSGRTRPTKATAVTDTGTVTRKSEDADPAAVEAAGELRQTMFMGDTVRGMLLNAYAFGTPRHDRHLRRHRLVRRSGRDAGADAPRLASPASRLSRAGGPPGRSNARTCSGLTAHNADNPKGPGPHGPGLSGRNRPPTRSTGHPSTRATRRRSTNRLPERSSGSVTERSRSGVAGIVVGRRAGQGGVGRPGPVAVESAGEPPDLKGFKPAVYDRA
jgi:hypothetical protein